MRKSPARARAIPTARQGCDFIFWKTKSHPWRAVGIALALAGLFLMTVPAGPQGWAAFQQVNRGDLLTIACAFAFAFQIVTLGRASERFGFESIAVLQIA